MDTFDVNLLSQVKALDQKMSVSHDQLHLQRKVHTEDKEKGKFTRRKSRKDSRHYEGEFEEPSRLKEKESTIDIIK